MKLHTTLAAFFALIAHSTAFGLVTVTVNTTTDEFGENLANCSLREAIESVNKRAAFGGCAAGERFGTNIIKLEAKEYILTRGELLPKAEVTITGIGTNADLKDSITNTKPKRHTPTTIINAQNKSRVFNTATSKAGMTLNHLKISNGVSEDFGGAILAGGSISANNVVFDSNLAKNKGGAIYLSGKDSVLSATDSLWQNNNVSDGVGAAIAMSCTDDLKPTTRTIDIIQSSFVKNGNTNAKSIFEGCGLLTFNLTTSTVGENTANNTGAIINFAADTAGLSSITVQYSTLVKNSIAPVFNFNNLTLIALNSSVVAFNENIACIGNSSQISYVGNRNLYQDCNYLKQAPLTGTTTSTDTFLTSPLAFSFSDEFNTLGDYGGFTPTYLPKATSQRIVNKGDACISRIDQRFSVYSDVITCDLGAVERRIALAVVDRETAIKNTKPDRIAEISVLDNDIPSETDLTDDQANARGQIAKDADGKYRIELTDNANGLCTIVHRTEESLLPLIRFNNGGIVMQEQQKTTCKYTFTDSNNVKAGGGILLFNIENKIPVAGNDSFLLASGSPSLTMNVVANDNDDNDGTFGSLCTENTAKCNGGYYIRVVSNPALGTIQGDSRACPDHTDTNKFICYRGDLTYIPKNTLAPFNDSFTYVIYDNDLGVSQAATVTIINQAGQSEEQNSGSLGWVSVLVLAGLTVYRRRKYRFV